MKIFTNNDYTISKPLDYTLDGFVILEPKFIDLMTQHRIEFFCSVDNTTSLNLELSIEQPNAMFAEWLG